MRKVYLDKLPKRGKYVDWGKSIGHSIPFQYDDIEGELPILDYIKKGNRGFIVTKYNGKDNIEVWIGAMTKCRLGSILGVYNIDYLYDVGDFINNLKHGSLEILEQTRIEVNGTNGRKRKLKGYVYKCKICGDIHEKTEDELKRGNGCSVCSGNKILKGYNDLWTKRPDIAKLLKYPERGHLVGLGSNTDEEVFICPKCGIEKSQILNNACKQGFSCFNCSDGISYPEKFMYRMLCQLKVDFKKGETFTWSMNVEHENSKLSGKKIYDFYIPSLKCIIETHGEQHYRYCGFDRTLEEEQENDRLKEQLAKDNGIENYIVIDCRHSETEWIKNNILNSSLCKLFDLTSIDWHSCDSYAQNSLVRDACDLYNSGMSIKEIGNQLGLSRFPISNYLKRGTLIGWCKYDPVKNRGYRKRVVQISLSGDFIKEWDTIKEAGENQRVNPTGISNVCNGRLKTSGGFKWMYKEDYEKYIKQAN